MITSSGIDIIKSAALRIPEVEKCVLFGSRARGDADEKSDWDVLIIVRRPMTFDEKFEIETKIRNDINGRLMPVDIMVASSEEADVFCKFPGSVIRHALAEGVTL